jgi:hypothetical protein
METGIEMRNSKLFMVIALVLTGTLLLGLVGIGGLVAYRLLLAPTEVAMPPQGAVPTVAPPAPATATPSPLPTATLMMTVPTPTLVISPGAEGTSVPASDSADGHDSPGLNSPGPDSSEMPQTGLGLVETVGLGLALASLLGGTRMARRLGARRE